MRRFRRAGALGVAVLLLAAASRAQTPQDWIKRILDPATIGVTMPPGAAINRKLSVDYLSKEDPPTLLAIYMVPLAQLVAASDHFAKSLNVKPVVTGADSEFELHKFILVGGGTYPAKVEGLTITITRSQFVDNKAQITLEYAPPKK